jgi:Glu-tRNA(Gln) amidotransferase subunit E-like FAD-binding protein
MPLTEVVTEPDLLTPRELEGAGRLIARIAHATGRVRRGAGAARQDVNVSVAGGRRVEIKGVSHQRGLPQLVHTEAFRQLELLRIRAELDRRGLGPDTLRDPDPGPPWESSGLVMDASAILAASSFDPLARALERGDTAVAIRLPGWAGILAHRTQPGLDFAHELADRVRVIACPVQRPFLAHSDQPERLSAGDWDRLRSALGAGGDDAMVVVWAPRDDAATAAREILIRAREAMVGVPAETRQDLGDGRTGFERVLPGPDRMYPDTDTPPLPIADHTVLEVRDALPETPWRREERYREVGLDPLAARRLAGAPWADLFDAAAPADPGTARRLARVLGKRVPFHARRARIDLERDDEGLEAIGLAPERVVPVVRAVEAGALLPRSLELALDDLAAEPRAPAAGILARYQPRDDDPGELEALVDHVAARAAALAGKPPAAVMRWAMGEVMRRQWGRADAAVVRDRLERALFHEEVEVSA